MEVLFKLAEKAMNKESAKFTVCAGGKGPFSFLKDSPNPFDPTDALGLMRTDALVLFF